MSKKIALSILTVLIALVSVLSGCGGPSIEELIRDDLSSQLELLKNDPRKAVGEIPAETQAAFDQIGLDPDAYLDALFDGFDYSIEEIAVEEDSATAKVSITCKSSDAISSSFETLYAERLNSVDPASIETQDAALKLAGQALFDATASSKPEESVYEFTYSKDDSGNWIADSNIIEVFLSSIG